MLLKREGRPRPGIKVVGVIFLLVSIVAMLGGCVWLQDWFNPSQEPVSPPPANVDNAPPISVIQSSISSGTAPLTVRLDASSSYDPDGDALKVTWLFGDGDTSKEIAPVHTYSTGGLFAVTLIVEDEKGATGTASAAIEVAARPGLIYEDTGETDNSGQCSLQLGHESVLVPTCISSRISC